MKSDNIKIGGHANHEIWKHGIKNPPHHIKVNVIKYEDGLVRAELFGFPVEVKKEESVKKGKKEAADANARKRGVKPKKKKAEPK